METLYTQNRGQSEQARRRDSTRNPSMNSCKKPYSVDVSTVGEPSGNISCHAVFLNVTGTPHGMFFPKNHNLSWKNVLCLLDKNKKMFPNQELQLYSIPVDERTMSTLDWIEHAFVANGESSAGPSKITPNKAASFSA